MSKRHEGYNIEGVPGHELGDIALAKRAGDLLNEHYPGYLWAVHVNDELTGGIMVVENWTIASGYGFVIKLRKIYQDPQLKCVVMAGGEMLERANLPRCAWDGTIPTFVDGVAPQDQRRW